MNAEEMAQSKKKNVYKLAKVIGAFAIMASAVSQEYGAGINFVAVRALGSYPEVRTLVPLAMFVTGFMLLPKVFMYQRFGKVASRSGSSYVWIGRTLTPSVSFIVNFAWWIGVTAGMGFLAYTVGTTLSQTIVLLGIPSGAWFSTTVGHVFIGLVVIWLIFLLHYSGIRSYGLFVTVLFGFILITAITVMAVGFTTPQSAFTTAIHSHGIISSPVSSQSSVGPLTIGSFFGVMTIFVFAYGGISAAPMLGGETRDAGKNMPRGIVFAWVTAIILYTLVSIAIFAVAPWQDVVTLINSNQSYYATAPGIVSLVTPKAVGLFVTVLVTIVLAKTVAPEMMSSSRLLFSWSEDGILHRKLTSVNRFRAPSTSLLISAVIGSVFLIDSSIVGWEIGVIIRATTILLVIMFLGFGVIKTRLSKNKKEWHKSVTTPAMVIAAVAGIIVAFVMIPTVLYKPGVSILFQPWLQLLGSVVISVIIYAIAYGKWKSNGVNLEKELQSTLPLE